MRVGRDSKGVPHFAFFLEHRLGTLALGCIRFRCEGAQSVPSFHACTPGKQSLADVCSRSTPSVLRTIPDTINPSEKRTHTTGKCPGDTMHLGSHHDEGVFRRSFDSATSLVQTSRRAHPELDAGYSTKVAAHRERGPCCVWAGGKSSSKKMAWSPLMDDKASARLELPNSAFKPHLALNLKTEAKATARAFLSFGFPPTDCHNWSGEWEHPGAV